MNLDHDFVQVSKLNEDQKKRSSPKMEHFFSPEFKWTPTLRCTPESNYWGDADVDHTQTIGGDTVKLLGDISPRVSAPLVVTRVGSGLIYVRCVLSRPSVIIKNN